MAAKKRAGSRFLSCRMKQMEAADLGAGFDMTDG